MHRLKGMKHLFLNLLLYGLVCSAIYVSQPRDFDDNWKLPAILLVCLLLLTVCVLAWVKGNIKERFVKSLKISAPLVAGVFLFSYVSYLVIVHLKYQ